MNWVTLTDTDGKPLRINLDNAFAIGVSGYPVEQTKITNATNTSLVFVSETPEEIIDIAKKEALCSK